MVSKLFISLLSSTLPTSCSECERDHHDFKKIVSRTKERIRRDNLKKRFVPSSHSVYTPHRTFTLHFIFSLWSLNNSLLAPLPKISVQGVLDRVSHLSTRLVPKIFLFILFFPQAIKDCNELKKKEMLLMPALQALRRQRTCLTRYLKLIRPRSSESSS